MVASYFFVSKDKFCFRDLWPCTVTTFYWNILSQIRANQNLLLPLTEKQQYQFYSLWFDRSITLEEKHTDHYPIHTISTWYKKLPNITCMNLPLWMYSYISIKQEVIMLSSIYTCVSLQISSCYSTLKHPSHLLFHTYSVLFSVSKEIKICSFL